jgi:hypothetical protein
MSTEQRTKGNLVLIRVNGKKRRVQFVEALMRLHLAKAISGDAKSIAAIAALLETTGLRPHGPDVGDLSSQDLL